MDWQPYLDSELTLAYYARVNSESKYGCQSIVIMFLVPTNMLNMLKAAKGWDMLRLLVLPPLAHIGTAISGSS